MANISLTTANVLYSLSNAVLIAGAIAALLGTFGSIWSGAIRERYSDERIAANEANTARANADAARANQETTRAQLELERLRAQVAWRTLSLETVNALRAALAASAGGNVTLAYAANDPEATALAIQISRAFDGTSWKIGAEQRSYAGALVFDIVIPGKETPEIAAIRQAFQVAKIPFSTADLPSAYTGFGSAYPVSAPLIMIGSKRPAPF